jgi:outer membrane protein assembly factor BamB
MFGLRHSRTANEQRGLDWHGEPEPTNLVCLWVARAGACTSGAPSGLGSHRYAADLKTGKVIWQTPMVPKGYTGGAIWSSTPAIDPTRGVVYITTGNNYTTPKEVAECQESGKRE